MAKAKKDQPLTGTERVQGEGGVRIPGPILPAPEPTLKKVEQKSVKKDEASPEPFTVVSSHHLVKTLRSNLEQNRKVRLIELARVNNDVAWLLAEYQANSKAEKTK